VKPTFPICLVIALLIGLSGCDSHRNILDFISDPVLPPVAQPATGTYDRTLTVYLDRGDENDSILYFTFNPDVPYTDLSQWKDYYATVTGGFSISASTSIRVFSYVSPARYSAVKTISWELKCPKANFSPSPGLIPGGGMIYLVPPSDPEFTVSYAITVDGTDPALLALGSPIAGGSGNQYIAYLSGAASNPLRVRAVTSRPGWSDSDPADAYFYAVAPAASSIGAIPAARVTEGSR
jgi:hypothetical protein